MAERKLYTVNIGGRPHRMLLDEDDAQRYGAEPVKAEKVETKAAEPKNKSRRVANKAQ